MKRKSKTQHCTNSATYAARLLESGCDTVTVQKLMGNSNIETTRQYLDPAETLKRQAVMRLSLKPKE
jgi:site-specific recombinase XerD